MDGRICYITTDLDLASGTDLTLLVSAFKAGNVKSLGGVTMGDDGQGYVTFNTFEQNTEPESDIAAMLAVIESLSEELQTVWKSCWRIEFNIGYDCGLEPWAFNQGLTPQLLGRMAAAGASLRITIYPDRDPVKPKGKKKKKKRK